MRGQSRDRVPKGPDGAVPPRAIAGLLQLLNAMDYARDVQRPSWDFAVEIEELRAAGLVNSDLRWLVCKAYAEHAVETTPVGSKRRSFATEGRLTIGRGSCFVLTASGMAFARRARRGEPAGQGENSGPVNGNGHRRVPGRVPDWDPRRRVLSVAGRVVKQYRVPAGNQQLILTAFQELGWQRHIDDPLPPVSGLDPKQRLEDAVSRLNRNQQNRLIRFHGDGTGRGLWWELLG